MGNVSPASSQNGIGDAVELDGGDEVGIDEVGVGNDGGHVGPPAAYAVAEATYFFLFYKCFLFILNIPS